jgi:nucleoid DNA-binding protein
MNWHSTGGKSGLAKMLMHEHGFSKRRAEKAVNAVFACMIGALKRGEEVEIPVGRIRAVTAPANRQRSVEQKFRNIQNQALFSRLVQHPKRIIRFSPDPKQIRRDPVASSPPAPPTPQLDRQQKGLDTEQNDSDRKQNELEQIFLRLVGRQITVPDLEPLLAAAVDPNKPVAPNALPAYLDRLLARFRQLLRNECHYSDCSSLQDAVRRLYWIRS